MQLKSISLKNIRSYSSLDLSFKEGSTLLSGDIGSGKTTMLLSIEFALFGLMKGMLSGSSLLRHGSKDGSVTLSFSIGKDTITVYRALKRSSSGITQDAGYLEINGDKKDYTAVELKSRILSILGYPDELLTKSKSLIFRYTVYTPQEDMKKIIFDSEEDRLEKLAKIFNIEKYKRIKENAETYAKELRVETKIMALLESELSSIKDSQKKYEMEMENKSILLQQINLEVSTEEKILKSSEEKIKSMEDSMKALTILKQELNILGIEKNNLTKNSTNMKNDISLLEIQRKRLSDELKNEQKTDTKEIRKLEEINEEINKYKEMKQKTELHIIDGKSKLISTNKKIEESNDIKKNIYSLTKCPTCQQDVDDSHKKHITG